MPVKINEVIIRAVIQPDNGPGGNSGGLSPEERLELVQASVNEVMRILDQKRRP
ncbi:MAG: DUF5908 family protein [Bacteroidota bacterium]